MKSWYQSILGLTNDYFIHKVRLGNQYLTCVFDGDKTGCNQYASMEMSSIKGH